MLFLRWVVQLFLSFFLFVFTVICSPILTRLDEVAFCDLNDQCDVLLSFRWNILLLFTLQFLWHFNPISWSRILCSGSGRWFPWSLIFCLYNFSNFLSFFLLFFNLTATSASCTPNEPRHEKKNSLWVIRSNIFGISNWIFPFSSSLFF